MKPYQFAEIAPAEEQLLSPSEVYHENSKIRADDRGLGAAISIINSTPEIRQIISAPHSEYRGFPVVRLPAHYELTAPYGKLLRARRSIHEFAGKPMSLENLATVLWAGDGVTSRRSDSDGSVWSLRTAPSGGGLYPIDIYCVALCVKGLEQGLYYFSPLREELQRIRDGDMAPALTDATFLREEIQSASAALVLTAVMPRTRFKYGERSYRFALLEAGHIAQNILLTIEAIGASALPVGGFVDDIVTKMIGLDGCEDIALYLILMGCRV
jgi:SagB-type dehydrogenase family enzyme